jgi:flagella synthesis protein FlgN
MIPASPAELARRDLIDLLQTENTTLRALERTVQQETDALLAGDRDALDQIVDSKQRQLDQLNGLDHDRRLWWATHHGMESPYGLAKFMRADAEMDALFGDSIERARRLQRQNDSNGKVVALRLRATRDALAVLGSAAGGQQPYGPDGRQPLRLPTFSVVAE